MFYFYAILFLIAMAVTPPALLMLLIYKMDKVEREPPKLMRKLFLFGLLATIPILVLEAIAEGIISIFSWSEFTGLFLMYFVVPGFVEEGVKYWMLHKKTWDEPNFNYKFDGVVYAVFISLGFALVENVMYVLSTGFMTAVLRAVISIPGHCIFGIIMGSMYGEAKALEETDAARSKKLRTKAWMIAALGHGLFDLLLVLNENLLFAAYFIVLVVLSLRRLKKSQREDGPVRQFTAGDVDADIL